MSACLRLLRLPLLRIGRLEEKDPLVQRAKGATKRQQQARISLNGKPLCLKPPSCSAIPSVVSVRVAVLQNFHAGMDVMLRQGSRSAFTRVLSIRLTAYSAALQVVRLLSLPLETLQDIALHFTLAEWVQGPAQACRLLHQMKLPRVDLLCYKLSGMV